MENTTENYFIDKSLSHLRCVHINLQNCKFFGSAGEPAFLKVSLWRFSEVAASKGQEGQQMKIVVTSLLCAAPPDIPLLPLLTFLCCPSCPLLAAPPAFCLLPLLLQLFLCCSSQSNIFAAPPTAIVPLLLLLVQSLCCSSQLLTDVT